METFFGRNRAHPSVLERVRIGIQDNVPKIIGNTHRLNPLRLPGYRAPTAVCNVVGWPHARPRGIPMDPNGTPMDPNGIPMNPNGIPMDPSGIPMDRNRIPVDPNRIPVDPNGIPVDPNVIPVAPNGSLQT